MHDPMTVAFEIRRPWPERVRLPNERDWWYWPPIITVWHVDPETDGTDDSCDWFGRRAWPRMVKDEIELLPEDARRAVQVTLWILGDPRPWWRRPKWHVRHWKIQIHAVQSLKRWLFSRCAACQKRFRWNYAPFSYQWHGGGPRWFRSEQGIYHKDCRPTLPVEEVRAWHAS